MRSESMPEVLSKILGRQLDYQSAADMGLLDQFAEMNAKLAHQPKKIQEKVRKLWFKSIRKINKEIK